MTIKEEQLEILKNLFKHLTKSTYEIGESGFLESTNDIFNSLCDVQYTLGEKLEELTGEKYIIEYGPPI